MKHRLLHGDCIERMNEIPEGSVDFILTDPPYGTTACGWDNIIPFEPMWNNIWRVLKPTGVGALFGSEPFNSSLRATCQGTFKYDWIWVKDKPSGFQHAKNMPLKNYEVISVFSKASMGHSSILGDRRMAYNPQGVTACEKTIKHALNKFGRTVGKRPSQVDEYVAEFTNYPMAVLNFSGDGCKFHPTQKPILLLEYLIKTYTNENDTVLDFTMGSGSTGVALY